MNKKYNLGVIVRSDNSGLGNQSRSLCRMLNPDRVLVVNSNPFNGNEQHPEWYADYDCVFTQGWPTDKECHDFIYGLTHVISAETIYNEQMYWLAKRYGTKIFIQPNWEFLDHLRRSIPVPHMWLMPSYWHLEDMKRIFPNTVYLPPPIIMEDFANNAKQNLKTNKKKRLLHVVGKFASNDRNGTIDLLKCLEKSKGKYELVIHTQFDLPPEVQVLLNDNRITLRRDNFENPVDIYKGFDAVIMPRRYAGLCLPMNESLASALPVIMPDISPNNQILPEEWLVPAYKKEVFMARTAIDVYESDLEALARKIDGLSTMSDKDITAWKLDAYSIASREYSSDSLQDKYKNILER